MNMPSFLHSAFRSRRGFTLVELLAVMGIMALLLVVTIPSIEGLNMSAGISQGGQLFTDEVSLARQTAAARNITVEFRCIQVPGRSDKGYSAMQLWSIATGAPISRLVTMPDGIVISEDQTKISPLFATFYSAGTAANPYKSTGTMPSGGQAANDKYVAFTISPAGLVGPLSTSTAPPNMTGASVGIVRANQGAATVLPTNYVIVQLNPLTAVTVAYRP